MIYQVPQFLFVDSFISLIFCLIIFVVEFSSFQGNSSSRMKDKDGKMSTTSGNKRSTKYRYGAWYLPKTLWHRAEADEGLRDPKLIQAELDDPSKKEEEKIVNSTLNNHQA